MVEYVHDHALTGSNIPCIVILKAVTNEELWIDENEGAPRGHGGSEAKH